MTFFLPTSRFTSCFGAISAVFSVASSIPALAMTKFLFAERIPASTFSRSSMFSRTRSRNWRISSSRLSFKSLWPLTAVTNFFFVLVNSIRVGVTCVDAIYHPPPYSLLLAAGSRPMQPLCKLHISTAFGGFSGPAVPARFRFASSRCGLTPYATLQLSPFANMLARGSL